MLNSKKVSLIIPCRNEANALSILLPKIPKFIDEVIVIDNNSTDGTGKMARKFGAKVLVEGRTTGGIGYGFAHQAGLTAATGDYIVAMDGDNTYPLGSIKKAICLLESRKLDFVACSRLPLARKSFMNPVRFIGNTLLTLTANLLFRLDFHDILSGMWVLRRQALPYLDLSSGGWNFSIGFKLSAAISPQVKFQEFTVPYRDRLLGSSKLSAFVAGWDYLVYLFNARWQGVLCKGLNFSPSL